MRRPYRARRPSWRRGCLRGRTAARPPAAPVWRRASIAAGRFPAWLTGHMERSPSTSQQQQERVRFFTTTACDDARESPLLSRQKPKEDGNSSSDWAGAGTTRHVLRFAIYQRLSSRVTVTISPLSSHDLPTPGSMPHRSVSMNDRRWQR
jgi:hypothetical protein